MADLSATPMIEALGLSKFYGSFAAVREVSFTVPQGLAHDLTNRFADWHYIISGADFAKLRLKRKDVVR